jgi:hypothetical protein
MRNWIRRCLIPLAIPSSPAVSSARVASLGRFSRTTDAAIVMGRAASWSGSASGGAEEGEGDGDGDGEGIFALNGVVVRLCDFAGSGCLRLGIYGRGR